MRTKIKEVNKFIRKMMRVRGIIYESSLRKTDRPLGVTSYYLRGDEISINHRAVLLDGTIATYTESARNPNMGWLLKHLRGYTVNHQKTRRVTV